MNRWQIMARLIELLESQEFIGVSCFGKSTDPEIINDVMNEACMRQVTGDIWHPGKGTRNWVIFWTHGAWAI